MIFQYWSNKNGRHDKLLFVCVAGTILEADAQFQNDFGIDVQKTPWIGCSLIKIRRKP